MAVAAALLAGVLARFAMQAFGAAGTAPGLVLSMLLVYLLGERWAASRHALDADRRYCLGGVQRHARYLGAGLRAGVAGVRRAGFPLAGDCQPGAAAVRGHHGLRNLPAWPPSVPPAMCCRYRR